MVEISDTSFVREWAKASKQQESLADLAKKLGMSYKDCWNRGKKLSSLGVDLPRLWGMSKVNSEKIEKLNQVVQKILTGSEH